MSGADPEAKTQAAGLETNPARLTSPEEAPPLLANRYELLGMLGAGAMGTVYRARDRELDEIVALKVLKKELASADMIERFRREVKLARRVTHRNVARTFDIGENGGDRFLTMEFVEGEMLGALLSRKGRLPLVDVVRFGLDICAGLAEAHAAGVLHRDLKPENVIIAKDGRAVITDFGIARAATQNELSRTVGGIVGTPAYMAPEQVEGSSDLDARTDLYALGTMLYELVTGQMAWQGDSIVTVAAGRLLRPPPDSRAIMPNLPPPLAELILKLMARRREDRFASAQETALALEALAPPPPGSSPSLNAASAVPRSSPSSGTLPLSASLPHLPKRDRAAGARVVAVLPVLNLGPSDDAYLVENVNEDVIDLLSVVPGILVRPRGDTARFDDAKRDVREVGRALGADVVVDASLRRIGETVRASFRLIAVEDGFQLWAKRFDRPPAQVLSIADDAAQAIARALTAEAGESKPRAAGPEAEDLFLRGRFLLRRSWQGVVRDAMEMLSRAHDLAPEDPRILGTYALSLARIYGMEFFGREVADRARALAEKAAELEPTQAEAKTALALVHFQNQEGEAAVRYFRAALAVAPNSVDALDWFGRLMAEIGRVEEAFVLFQKATAVDPEIVQARQQTARLRSILGNSAGMVEALGPLPTHPGDVPPWFVTRARDLLWRRDAAGATKLREILNGLTQPLPEVAHFAIDNLLKVALGDFELLRNKNFLDRALPVDTSRSPRRAAFNAQIRAELLGFSADHEDALESLRMADASGLLDIVWLRRCPLFDPLRSRPEFVSVLERVTQRTQRVALALDARSPVGL
jgi:serine/threonine protein kinase/tetratricopeptide (TPR) repeat protein